MIQSMSSATLENPSYNSYKVVLGRGSVVEHLFNMGEILCLIPSIGRENNNGSEDHQRSKHARAGPPVANCIMEIFMQVGR